MGTRGMSNSKIGFLLEDDASAILKKGDFKDFELQLSARTVEKAKDLLLSIPIKTKVVIR